MLVGVVTGVLARASAGVFAVILSVLDVVFAGVLVGALEPEAILRDMDWLRVIDAILLTSAGCMAGDRV